MPQSQVWAIRETILHSQANQISGYGQDGPYSKAAGYDVIIEAEAGLMYMLASVLSTFFSVWLILPPNRDTFIYEYVGDVVNNASFKKRMREYANEGIQHFYFMMLQKDEVRHLPLSIIHVSDPHKIVHRRHKEWRNWSIRKPQL